MLDTKITSPCVIGRHLVFKKQYTQRILNKHGFVHQTKAEKLLSPDIVRFGIKTACCHRTMYMNEHDSIKNDYGLDSNILYFP